MIFHDVAQGEPEWFQLRLGIPTASEFDRIITPKTMKMSSQASDYADLKIAEIMTGEPQGLLMPTYHMERGKVLEVEAREAYEFTNTVRVTRGGFATDDAGYFGASGDFRVSKDGGGEIKCLEPKKHVKYLIRQEIDPENIPQVQGQIFIYEWEWCDYWMYHPDLPRAGIRTFRDEKYIAALADCLNQFRDLMGEKIIKLQQAGNWIVNKPNPETGEFEDLWAAG